MLMLFIFILCVFLFVWGGPPPLSLSADLADGFKHSSFSVCARSFCVQVAKICSPCVIVCSSVTLVLDLNEIILIF